MTTLQEALKVLESTRKMFKIKHRGKRKIRISDELLGKYKGVIPKGKTSTQFIRELRNSSYGKFKYP